MVVKNNLTAMNSNRMLGLTTKTQAKSTEKLSSGYKINRAADDAAGLSISEKMRRQIRGLTQASANASDGISCVQTAEGALNEIHDMLQRMEELAVKGANGTLTSVDRSYITQEVRQLMSEIDRVQSTTTFNEQNLLDGTFQNKGLMVGAEAGQHIAITIGNMSTNDLIASALSKGLFYHMGNDSPVCVGSDKPHPSTAPYPAGAVAYWIPGNGTTFAKQEYWDKSTIPPWGSPGHSHINAIEVAAGKKAFTITLTGFGADNRAKGMGDINVYVPCHKYGIVESIHNLILQQVVDLIMDRDGVKL